MRDGAWADGEDSDPLGSVIHGHLAGEGEDGPFGGGVGRDAALGLLALDAGHVEDHSVRLGQRGLAAGVGVGVGPGWL